MTSNPVFYQILLGALVLICLMVHVGLPDDPPPAPQTPLAPRKRRRRRSKEPKPFTGLMHTPRCEACEQGTDTRPTAPGLPPPVIAFARGRRRTVDTSQHCCPDDDCASHGWLGRGNLRANGHPGSQPWRQVQCGSCHGDFSETHGTLFHGTRSSPARIVRVMACLADGLGIRGTARVFEIDPHTVRSWLVEAAAPLHAFSAYCLHELQINQGQLDERYAVRSAVRDGDVSAAEAIDRWSRSPHWVWMAIDSETTWLLSVQVGERTLAMAHAVLYQIAQSLAPGWVPLLLRDGSPQYLPAIVTHCGHWVQPPRRQARGPAPTPRGMPLPALRYAQVVKTMRRRRIVEVKHRVVFGTQAAGDQVVAACGWQINTAFVERLNLRLRQRGAAMRRRRAASGKSQDGVGQQLVLFQVYHNCVLPHASIRQALAEAIPPNGTGSARQWRPRTPAMAAGLTDHVWSRREGLRFRVPPWSQPQPVYAPLLAADRGGAGDVCSETGHEGWVVG